MGGLNISLLSACLTRHCNLFGLYSANIKLFEGKHLKELKNILKIVLKKNKINFSK